MRNKPAKQSGDRKDAYRVRNIPPITVLMAGLLGDRTDNEAVLNAEMDMTAAEAYLARRNAEDPQYKFTLFHLIVAAIAKTFALRPKLNYFMANGALYERENITFAFVAKNKFADNGAESVVIMKIDEEDDAPGPIEQAHDKICAEVYKIRGENVTDGTTEQMDWLAKLPGWVLKLMVRYILSSDRRGKLMESLRSVNPYDASVFISNLGSIRMSANYHHLANFGSNSVFAIIGEEHLVPAFDADGQVHMHQALELGLTIDERIGDGFYFARSVKLVKHLLTHPELLERPLYEPVDWEE